MRASSAVLARALWALAVVSALAGVAILVTNLPMGTGRFVRDGLVPAVVAVTYATAGSAIASRRPGNRIAWILLLFGISFGLTQVAAEYAVRGLVTAPGSLPWADAAAWLQYPLFGPVFPTLLPLLILLFPDGYPPVQRLRPLVWLFVLAGLVTILATGLGRGPVVSAFRLVPLGQNPLGLFDLTTAESLAVGGVEGVALLLAAVATVARLVRSRGAERQQMKWLAFTGAATAICAVGSLFFGGLLGEVALDAMIFLISLGFPVAIAVAVLRHRLFDIDMVIHRSFVYALLAAFITGIYVAVVAGVGSLIGTHGHTSPTLSILATALVAVIFQPVRERLQRLANRVVYGRRASPYEVMAEFAHRIAGAVSGDDVLPALAEVTARAVGAPGSRVRLRLPGGDDLHVCWPRGTDVSAVAGTAAVVSRGERLGDISVQQSMQEPLSLSQRILLTDLAVQAGPVFRNVHLTSELRQRMDEVSTRAEKIRESRERLVSAADAQRRRLDEQIQAGTQRQLEAIGERLAGAEELLVTDPSLASALLNTLADEAQIALEGLRDLARGVFPPLLADRGVIPALEAHIRKAGLAAGLEVGPGVAGARFDPQLEATLYFSCVESLPRAAGGELPEGPITIRLVAADGRLELTVPKPGLAALREVADRVEALGGSVEEVVEGVLLARIPVDQAGQPV